MLFIRPDGIAAKLTNANEMMHEARQRQFGPYLDMDLIDLLVSDSRQEYRLAGELIKVLGFIPSRAPEICEAQEAMPHDGDWSYPTQVNQ